MIRYVTRDQLQTELDSILARYPWFPGYPIQCHKKCTRWDIQREHGVEAGEAWDEYHSTLWLLGG